MDAYGAASNRADIRTAVAAVQALWPDVRLRPAPNGRSVNVEDPAGESMALFYLAQHRARVRDPELTRIAHAAICGIAALAEAPAA
jgi:hypothetical protein